MADELNDIAQLIESGGQYDVKATLEQLDEIIKIAKGTKKTHKHRDLTNLCRANTPPAHRLAKWLLSESPSTPTQSRATGSFGLEPAPA